VPILDWGKAKGTIKMAESNQDLEITAVEQDIIDFQNRMVFHKCYGIQYDKKIQDDDCS